jgi:hypothetical protein
MQHVTEEQLVSHYYHDAEGPAAIEEHLAVCAECREQYATLRRVLALVAEAPLPERGETYREEVWTRLRWKLGAQRRLARIETFFAAAAILAIAFVAGAWWHARQKSAQPPLQQTAAVTATHAAPAAAASGAASSAAAENRVLVVVVDDHLETSERLLAELANADPRQGLDISAPRAAALAASNRIYRQSAAQKGDRRIAELLSDLEPILVELSHAGPTLTHEQLTSIQKRIEEKGLLFKVRVMSTPALPANSHAL